MRNIRSRRRFRIALISLLVISTIAFFENRIEAVAPQLKGLAEERIEGAFGKNFDISIGNVDGGILRPLALRNVRISSSGTKQSSRIFLINSIVSNYRVWDFAFPGSFKKAPSIAINFETKNRELAGFVTITGTAEDAVVRGRVRLFGSNNIEVEGWIKNGIARLVLKTGTGAVNIEGNFAADGVLLINIKVNHFKFREVDISGDVAVRNIAVKNSLEEKEANLEGDIEARNVILDYKPFYDLKASYVISNGSLNISNLDIGGMLYLNGKFGLSEPYLIDAVVTTDNMNLPQVLSAINPRYGSAVEGTLNSKWEFKGTINNLRSNIRLEMRKGRIGEASFEYLSASLKGDGPIVRIEDARILRESGPVTLGGEMDLRRMGKESVFEHIKILGGENTMVWDGWETAKWQDVREFRMTKNVAGGFNVGFKKYVNDERIDESLRERDQFEVGYSLHPNDTIKVKFGDNSNFFGLEHKDKF